MTKKKSYMSKSNLMTESFIDDLIKKFAPGLQKKSEKKYYKKNKRKFDKLEKDLRQSIDKSNKSWDKFSKNFE